jgi:hypothetical protein
MEKDLKKLNEEMLEQSKRIADGERKVFLIGRELATQQLILDRIKRTTHLEVAAETIKDIKPNPEDAKNPIVHDTGKVRFTNDVMRAAEVSRRLEISNDARDAARAIKAFEDDLNKTSIETDVQRRLYSIMRIQYEYLVLGRRDIEKK